MRALAVGGSWRADWPNRANDEPVDSFLGLELDLQPAGLPPIEALAVGDRAGQRPDLGKHLERVGLALQDRVDEPDDLVAAQGPQQIGDGTRTRSPRLNVGTAAPVCWTTRFAHGQNPESERVFP
jgi:hypothetical protein